MVRARAWLGPTLPTMYHCLVVGSETGHRFSREENPWSSTTKQSRGRASHRFMYMLWRS